MVGWVRDCVMRWIEEGRRGTRMSMYVSVEREVNLGGEKVYIDCTV